MCDYIKIKFKKNLFIIFFRFCFFGGYDVGFWIIVIRCICIFVYVFKKYDWIKYKICLLNWIVKEIVCIEIILFMD